MLIDNSNKKVDVFHDGKVVVVKPATTENEKIIVPFFCPVCDYPMKTAADAESYRNYICCNMCELFWKRSNIEIPEKTSERWQSYMQRRHVAFLPSLVLK